jgi:hypothetical protein
MNCDKVRLLLSKYADNEASVSERDIVRAHIAGCADCARRLAEFEQVHALFSSAPTIPPEPQLRVGLFREINLMQEEERRNARRAREKRPWYMPTPAVTSTRRPGLARLLAVFNPVGVALVAVLAFFGVMVLSNSPTGPYQPQVTARPEYLPVPTVPVVAVNNESIWAATKGVGTLLPTGYASATLPPSDEGNGFLLLSDPTPVLENLDASGASAHTVRDAAYGYSIQYPANWWTQVVRGVRYFRPWKSEEGGTYWIELHVEPNVQNHTAESYNRDRYAGAGSVVRGGANSPARLRRLSNDGVNYYDDLLSFNRERIYTLRLNVPKGDSQSDLEKRWQDAEAVFSSMSGGDGFMQGQPRSPGYGTALFLNGSDLYAVKMTGQAQVVARGADMHGVIREYSLSPDARTVALTLAKNPTDFWGSYLYIANVESETPGDPTLLWSSTVEIRGLAWYNERVLFVLARTLSGSGIYRVTLPNDGRQFDPSTMIRRITELNDNMASGRGLAVSPDRQLVTFLAPIGESAGTDIYAVRPNGRDLRRLISHAEPAAPIDSGTRLLQPEQQAIKSYTWLGGRLEGDGYRFNLLFTCGNALFPTLYRGGFLYSSGGNTSLLDSSQLDNLGISDPTKLEIVHIAYSTDDKVAFTGYYTDFEEGRADKLAGLWTADVEDGQLNNIESQPIPSAPHGIADLQWSPDNTSLVYRETIPQAPDSFTDRYSGDAPFIIIKLDLETGTRTVLYNRTRR